MDIVSDSVNKAVDRYSDFKKPAIDPTLKVLVPTYEGTAAGYYRFLTPLVEAREHNYMPVLFRDDLEEREFEAAIQWANIISMGRSADDEIARVSFELQKYGTFIVIDQDDYPEAVLDTQRSSTISGWTDEIMDKNQRMIRGADLLTVTNSFLKEVYSSIRKGPVEVLPNQIDSMNPRWNFPRQENKDKIVLGWMGGYVHISESDFAAEVVSKIMSKYPHVYFKAVGFVDEWMQQLPKDRVTLVPGADKGVTQYPALMADMDIGIAPLDDNDFNKGKSDLKFLEYTMAGVLPVVQDYSCYNNIPKSVAQKCTDIDSWVDKISYLIENPQDRKKAYKKAQTYVINERSIYSNCSKWYRAYKEMYNKAWQPTPTNTSKLLNVT